MLKICVNAKWAACRDFKGQQVSVLTCTVSIHFGNVLECFIAPQQPIGTATIQQMMLIFGALISQSSYLSLQGTKKHPQTALEQQVEAMGAHLSAYTSREHTAYYMKTLSKDLPKGEQTKWLYQ